MKKIIALIIIVLVVVVGYFVVKNMKPSNPLKKGNEPAISQKVDKLMSGMTIDEKIGQMLVIYYMASSYDDTLSSAIESAKPGGFILFKDNIKSYTQVATFIKNMQEDSEIPMFISVDQEGGSVQRLENLDDADITTIPAMRDVGDTNDKDLAYDVGTVIGEELKAFGINMDNAPVIDIDSNPNNTVIGNRAFGTNANIVSKMGIALGKGINNSGVIPVYKHFPGHGDTYEDSHYTLPILNKTKDELYDLELKPFIEAIKNEAKVIMVGHIALPKITGDNTPASLSSVIVKDLLIDELGFKGVVITDALNMGALTKNYTAEKILINAINAGVDMLLMPGSSKTTITTIKKALDEGKITDDQINNSVRKILTLKYESGLFDKKALPNKDILGSEKHQEIVAKISR